MASFTSLFASSAPERAVMKSMCPPLTDHLGLAPQDQSPQQGDERVLGSDALDQRRNIDCCS
eukprot:5737801-Amphidinium_carterae.1